MSKQIKAKTQRNPKSRLDNSSAEKGWINLSAKMETHNFHLKNKQAVATANFKVSSFLVGVRSVA
jgi:hypothetical protein